MFEIVKHKDDIIEIKKKLLSCCDKEEVKIILIELINILKRYNIDFLRNKVYILYFGLMI
ncbi:MAG: hypothetical protein PHY80_01400 [Rickettsiales bacterium]|nr:hypothetical protein [Rickettsiales bacterium]